MLTSSLLAGNFDLDPDRTLDIILDTFSDQLIQHHQFFLDLLSVSPWAPKKPATPAATSEATNGKGKKPLVDVGYENDTGSFLIAQILGFKFGYYQVRPLATSFVNDADNVIVDCRELMSGRRPRSCTS